MDSFLKNTLLSKLTEDEVENMNRLLSVNSIKFIKKNPLTKQTSDLGSFSGEFYQKIMEEILILYKLLENRGRRNTS